MESLVKLNINIEGKICMKNDNFSENEIRVKKSYFLFPTIERMKASPNGRSLWPVLKYFRWLAVFLSFIVYLLPNFVKIKILKYKYMGKVIAECCEEACLTLVHPRIINNMMVLAQDELSTVSQLKIDII